MSTARQILGNFGEKQVVGRCACPKCKRSSTLKRLPTNFKCADVVCDFCGYLAQVKSVTVKDAEELPNQLMGAAWGPQNERMNAAIYFPLFVVTVEPGMKRSAIFYLSADLQRPEMFKARKPLSESAKRAGWRGFLYDLSEVKTAFVRLI